MMPCNSKAQNLSKEGGSFQEYEPITEIDEDHVRYMYSTENQDALANERETLRLGDSPNDPDRRHWREGLLKHDGLMEDLSISSPQQTPSVLSSLEYLGRPAALDISVEEKALVHEDPTWRPAWLRPFVLATFAGLFSCAAVALLIMLCYSHKNDGLFRTGSTLTFWWKFGPTAVLTLVAGLWTRVELQSQIYMPWIVLRQEEHDGGNGSDLDYTSMMTPALLYHSLRRKHFLVFSTALVSLLLKIQVVLMPGLLHPGQAQVSGSTPVQVLDAFRAGVLWATDEDLGTEDEALSEYRSFNTYYTARAIKDYNLSYPFGLTGDAAFQLFVPRGSPNAPITVRVDGFFTDMHCLKLETFEVQQATDPMRLGFILNFEGCLDVPIELPKEEGIIWGLYTPLNDDRPCRSLPQENPQYVFSTGTLELPSIQEWSQQNVKVVAFAAVICSPTAWTSEVEVVDNGISTELKKLEDQSQTPLDVAVWTMLDISMPITFEPGFDFSLYSSDDEGDFGYGPAGVWAHLQNEATDGRTGILNTTDALYDSMIGLTRKLGPIAGHYCLRHNESAEIMGDERRQVVKLKVVGWIGYSMVVVFALIASINIFVFIRYNQCTKVWNRDPATVLGSILFFQAHQQLIDQKIRFDEKHTDSWQDQSGSVPVTLRKLVQTAFSIVVIVMIATVLYTSKLSNANIGLLPIENDNQLLWTSLPTLIVLGIALYTTSFNSSLRGLFVLHILSKEPCSSQQLDIALLDMLGPQALYSATRRKAWLISLSQFLASLCAFLTTIASTLFTAEYIQERVEFKLKQQSVFGNRPLKSGEQHYWNNRVSVGSLVLQKGENLTYPENTFGDLAFPSIGNLPPSIAGLDRMAEGTHIEMYLPAATLMASCENHSQALSIANTTDGRDVEFDVRIPVTCSNGTSDIMRCNVIGWRPSKYHGEPRIVYAQSLGFGLDEYSLCGVESSSDDDALVSAPSITQVYFWGVFDTQKSDFSLLQAWQCQYSWAKVMVSVDMISTHGKLVINHNNPPRPNRSTLVPWESSLLVPFLQPDDDGASYVYGSAFPKVEFTPKPLGSSSQAFNILLPPYGKVSFEAFSDLEQSWDIVEALNYDRALLSAQLLNLENRLGVEEMPSEELELLNAVLINNNAKRLFQNPTSTYLLVGILSIVGTVHIFMLLSSVLRRFTTWRRGLLDMDVKGLAPDGFSSIAMMAALLDSSKFEKHVPEDSHKLSKEDLYDRLSSMRFRMGWFRRESDRTMHFTVGVMDDDDFRFVGNKEDVGYEDINKQDVDSSDVDRQDMDSEGTLQGEERSEIERTGRPVSTA
ncbi:hypothetical protein CTAM01_10633 [Colletotrichum tamarilloi]|uniref:Uncharacterized protein n=1 Tax=Colletotrichum tamarilloi TaxID=1209934 RepID=A0ABQ9R004_9PEZI|nr:uncharacterized protein CTAM01_10633 [Colletotrichum tamarilloi]KAK1490707.1 hypothetical protein CTAM01_10633 [Colletotrichum tamarilloi]